MIGNRDAVSCHFVRLNYACASAIQYAQSAHGEHVALRHLQQLELAGRATGVNGHYFVRHKG